MDTDGKKKTAKRRNTKERHNTEGEDGNRIKILGVSESE